MKYIFSYEIVRFLLIGILNTLVGYLFFIIFYYFIQKKIIALILAYVFGMLFNYKTYSKYVFTAKDKQIFINFVFVYVFVLSFNIFILEILNILFKINIYLSQFIVICIATPVLYFLNKKYVFIKEVD